MGELVCSFTGHRKIFPRHEERLENALSIAIDNMMIGGVSRFCSGGAIGFDLIAARIVLEKRDAGADCKLVMILPCRDQAKSWSAEWKQEYERILSLADEVICLSETYYRACMHVRNHRLVDEADMLIAYLGQETGGTSSTVKYAKRKGKEVINLCAALDMEVS